jgi:hypothetical protein
VFGRNHQFDSGLYEDFRVYGVSPGMFYNIQILNCREIFSKEPTIRNHCKFIACILEVVFAKENSKTRNCHNAVNAKYYTSHSKGETKLASRKFFKT